jgi:hypothetical protein|tara:strand:+ start:814 stop:966 length:153 start_codon:yes stop_codon:yes gene_type:complete
MSKLSISEEFKLKPIEKRSRSLGGYVSYSKIKESKRLTKIKLEKNEKDNE